jgi:hypothetical protein
MSRLSQKNIPKTTLISWNDNDIITLDSNNKFIAFPPVVQGEGLGWDSNNNLCSVSILPYKTYTTNINVVIPNSTTFITYIFNVTFSGQTITLPNATTLGLTFPTLNIQNNGSNILVVKNAISGIIKVIPAGCTVMVQLLNNSSSAGVWEFINCSLIVIPSYATLAYLYNGVGGIYSAYLGNNTGVTVSASNQFYLSSVDSSGFVTSGPIIGYPGWLYSSDTLNRPIVLSSSQVIVLSDSNSSPIALYATLYNISSLTPTIVGATLSQAGNNSYAGTALSATKVLWITPDVNGVIIYAAVITCSSSTITCGARNLMITTASFLAGNPFIITLTTTKALMFYADGNNAFIKAVVLNVAGDVVTKGTVATATYYGNNAVSAVAINATTVGLLWWEIVGADNMARFCIVTIASDVVTFGPATSLGTGIDVYNTYYSSLQLIDSTHLVGFMVNTFYQITLSGTTVTSYSTTIMTTRVAAAWAVSSNLFVTNNSGPESILYMG